MLDLTCEYWQVPVAESAWEKIAFVTPFGLYQFKVILLVYREPQQPFKR